VISDRPPPQGTPHTTLNGARYGTISAPQKPTKNTAPLTPNASAAEPAEGPLGETAREVTTKTVVEKHPELCDQANDVIFKLETFPRIRTTDDDGTVRFMTEEEIGAQLETAKKVAEANC
jgi:hypothetical protein